MTHTAPTAAFSITLDCRLDNVPGTLGRLCNAIGDAGGNIGALDGFDVRGPELRRCLVVHCRDEAHQQKVVDAVRTLTGVTLVDWWDRTFRMHEGGKIEVKAPECFEIEERLKASLDIPVFHDDQHGTAVVTLAALWNSLKITGKHIGDLSVVIAGMGAAGVAIGKILINAGVGEIVGADRQGAVYSGRGDLNPAKQWFADHTNPARKMGTIGEVLRGADVFVGVSGPDLITAADVRTMAANPIVFAMANPNPEIRPEQVDGLAAVMATGRSDYPNQINNVLAFPGIFRGALDVNASDITEGMKLAAAIAIAESVSDADLAPHFVVPSVFDHAVVDRVAPAVARAAAVDGVARA